MLLTIILFSIFPVLSFAENIPKDGDKELKLVQIVWRHGDRNPTDSYNKHDVNTKEFWDTRGGMGELTTRGMEMQVSLGTKLRKRYIDSKFMSSSYSPAEIYVRSTDVNRTIISAISNMIGMYGQGDGSQAGVQYPNFQNTTLKWPGAYVPIAIHTVDDDTDYLGNANAECPRQDAVWKFAMENAPEIQKLKKDPTTVEVQDVLYKYTNTSFPIDSLWIPHDVMFIENDNGLPMPAWWNTSFMKKLTDINNKVEDFQDGIGLNTLKGVDFSVELPKMRAGSLTNDMVMHMNIKLNCPKSAEKKCNWINNLKYYAYSAHDETIASFLATLGAKSAVVEAGYPLYSAAAIVELWTDSKNNADYFKLIYHKGYEEGFKTVTEHVIGCTKGEIYCNLDVFRKRAELYSPGNAGVYCQNTNILPTQLPTSTITSRSSNILNGFISILPVTAMFVLNH